MLARNERALASVWPMRLPLLKRLKIKVDGGAAALMHSSSVLAKDWTDKKAVPRACSTVVGSVAGPFRWSGSER